MASKKQNRTGSNSGEDIYSVLHGDHERVATLLEQMAKSDTGERAALLQQIKTELDKHSTAEEIVFYPKLKEVDQELVTSALDEHDEVVSMLSELEEMPPEQNEWMDRFTELKEAIEAHVQLEEKQLFPVARELFSAGQARELGEQVNVEKQQVA